jgi:hypothetical protein
MTQEEFLAKYRYEFAGRILDAAIEGRRGMEFAHFCKTVFLHVDQQLRQMWFDASGQKPIPKEEKK